MRLAIALLVASGAACAVEAPAPAGIEVFEAGIPELQRALEAGETTSEALVEAYLARIEAYDRQGPELQAVLVVNPGARERARALDAERAEQGPRGPLHGIPILLKDNFDTRDLPTTAGSVALAGGVPPEDATVVARLRDAGAIVLGKTNLHEWAFGYTTISSAGGQTRNPYDPSRNPGGSSGGTGAAVAASFAALGYGTDTCGSVRVPAAFNALYGIRPTKGFASIQGLVPLSSTQDTPGPLARSMTDLALGLQVLYGVDPADPATARIAGRPAPDLLGALDRNALRGARIGVLLPSFGTAPEDAEVAEVVQGALARMAEAGAVLVEVPFPELDGLLAGTSVITQEFRTDLEAYLSRRADLPVRTLEAIVGEGLFHPAVEGALRTSLAAPGPESPAWAGAMARRESATAEVLALLRVLELDALAYPTSRRVPAEIGAPQGGINCPLSAATGFPALTVPAGLTPDGLPVGLELLAGPHEEARLLALGYAWEEAARPRTIPTLVPPLSSP